MKNSSTDVLLQTDYDLYKYSFVVEPGTEINANIAQEQKRLKKNYEHKVGSKIQFHITIASFFAEEVMEETLVRSIQNICNIQKSFTVSLYNYKGYPFSGFYVEALDCEPFKKLLIALKILDGFMVSNECPPLSFTTRTQLNFSSEDSNSVTKKYTQEVFQSSFTVDRLFLLKQDTDQTYHHINTFILPRF